MAEFPFRDALALFKERIQGAIRNVNQGELDAFVEEFAGDFATMLSVSNGDAIWRRDGARIQELGRYLGTFAEFFATAEGGRDAVVRNPHLKDALRVISPRCAIDAEEGSAERGRYCRSVSL
jgi:hypothetical protein